MFHPADQNYYRFEQEIRGMAAHCQRVADFGTPGRFYKAMAPFASLFAGNYQAFAGPGGEPQVEQGVVDGVCDLQQLAFPDGHFDGVICTSVLEHVPKFWLAAQEMTRVLRPGGRLLVTIPWIHPFHEGGAVSSRDFWRVSKRGAVVLFEGVASLEVVEYDGVASSISKLLPGAFAGMFQNQFARKLLNRLDRRDRADTSEILIIGRK